MTLTHEEPRPRHRAICLTCKAIAESTRNHERQSCACGAITLDGGTWYYKASYDDERNYRALGNREPTAEELTCPSPVAYAYRFDVERDGHGSPVGAMRASMDEAMADAHRFITAAHAHEASAPHALPTNPWVEILTWRRPFLVTFARQDLATHISERVAAGCSIYPMPPHDLLSVRRVVDRDATAHLPLPPAPAPAATIYERPLRPSAGALRTPGAHAATGGSVQSL